MVILMIFGRFSQKKGCLTIFYCLRGHLDTSTQVNEYIYTGDLRGNPPSEGSRNHPTEKNSYVWCPG